MPETEHPCAECGEPTLNDRLCRECDLDYLMATCKSGPHRTATRAAPLNAEELERVRRRLADVLPTDDAVRLLATLDQERLACAAYCLDRADQYDTNCGIWPALADAAEGIAKGEAAGMLERGETEDLVARVRKLAGFKRKTHSKPRAM